MNYKVNIPFGHKAKCMEVSEPVKDTGFYERNTKGRISIVPTTTYCPSCSATHEFKYGKVIRKWELKHQDLNFELSYQKDEKGNLYAQCDDCGFDLRKDVVNHRTEEDKLEKVKRDIYLEGAYYKEGCYFINYEDFKATLQNLKEGDNVRFCIKQKIGPSLNILNLSEEIFKNLDKLVIEGSKVGIPRNYWRNN